MAQTEKTVAIDLGTNDREWLDGATYDSGTDKLTIDMTALDTGIRPSDADSAVATGDIREVLFGVLDHIFQTQQDRANTLLTPAGSATDVLVGMVITKSETMVSGTDTKRTTYKYVFTRTVGDKASFALATPTQTTGVED